MNNMVGQPLQPGKGFFITMIVVGQSSAVKYDLIKYAFGDRYD